MTLEEAPPASVLIVEDHPVLRDVFRAACDATGRLRVVGEAQTGEEAVRACSALAPEVVLLDQSLPDEDGIEVARRLREAAASLRILILSTDGDGHTALSAMRAGVDGFVEKNSGVRDIGRALVAVARGERVFRREHQYRALQELGRLARSARESSKLALTERELEILQLLATGLTLRQVATRLSISPRTVETHVAKLYRKFGVTNRVQVLRAAASMRLIEIG